MNPPTRIDLAAAPAAGIALFAAALFATAISGAFHPELRPLVLFAVAFPLLWVGATTVLSVNTARSLRNEGVQIPTRIRAMGSFRLSLTLSLNRQLFPAIGVMTKAKFRIGDVVSDLGPWADIPNLTVRRAATTVWDVKIKKRGTLFVGPFSASVELPGSLVRATAVFEETHAVSVLPAEYQLHPFVDTLLSGRHVAVGRFQKIPVATEEYVGAREYRPGDNPKLIHRVLSLRQFGPNEFYVREFQDPSREDLSIVLDTATPLDGDEMTHRYRLEKAVSFVSALCRMFAARRLTVRFVAQRGLRDMLTLRLHPLDVDMDRLERQLSHIELGGDRATIGRVLINEVRRFGASVIFVSLRPREGIEQQRLPIVTLTPDHVPVFTREVVWQQ
ncbi:MAG: DUF58 domain-containing protein [Vulcanimicrobiaceae bacterium]